MDYGDEWTLFGEPDVDDLKECADAICEAWPDGVIEDTAAGEFAYSVDALVPTADSEICVYRDLEAARHWQKGGANRVTFNTMIQISLVPAGLRLIADDWRDPELKEVSARLGRLGSESLAKRTYCARRRSPTSPRGLTAGLQDGAWRLCVRNRG